MSGNDTIWPLPKFYFAVDIEGIGTDLPFQEVDGLDTDPQVIEYRAGDSKSFQPVKLSEIAKTSTVTLKMGVLSKDNKLFDWYHQVTMNTIKPASVTIRLLDTHGKPTMTWKLANAWPIRITGLDLKSDGTEVAIETLEIAHEGLTLENG